MKIYNWRNNLVEIDLTPSTKLIGFLLSEHYREGKRCYPSITRLCEIGGFGSRNTVIKAIQELKNNNLITIKKEKVKRFPMPCNVYSFMGVSNSEPLNEPSPEPSPEPSVEPSPEPSLSEPEIDETIETDKTDRKKIKKENNFEQFWSEYPKQRAGSKSKAKISYEKVLKENRCSEAVLLVSVRNYAKSEEVSRGYAKGCSAWLNDDRFNNNYSISTKEETTSEICDRLEKGGKDDISFLS